MGKQLILKGKTVKYAQLPGFRGSVKGPAPSRKITKWFSPDPWQKRFFNFMKDVKSVRHVLLNAPMGSGKSWAVAFASAWRLYLDPTLRLLIAVPQDIIAEGFKEEIRFRFLGKDIWNPDLKYTRKQLNAWLKTPGATINGRIAIVSHSLLRDSYKNLVDCMVWIDEGHHALSTKKRRNGLGRAATYILRNAEKKNLTLGLITATFFRGDCMSVLTDKQLSLFRTWNLSWFDHLTSFGTFSWSYDFLITTDYLGGIKKLFKDRIGKTIISIPMGVPVAAREKLVESIVTFLESLGLNVLDLTNTPSQTKNKKLFANARNDKDAYDVIVAQNMMKEGADWPCADRLIVVGKRGSLVDLIQTIGRLFRKFTGKTHIEIFQILPFHIKSASTLNNFLTAVHEAMLIGGVLSLDDMKSSKEKVATTQPTIDEMASRLELLNSVMKQAIVMDDFDAALTLVSQQQNITETEQKWIVDVYARQNKMFSTLSGYDMLKDASPLDMIKRYTSGICGIDTITDLRRVYTKKLPYAEIKNAIDKTNTMAEAARMLNVNQSKFMNDAKSYGLYVYADYLNVTKKKMQKAISETTSMKAAWQHLGIHVDKFKKLAQEYGIWDPQFKRIELTIPEKEVRAAFNNSVDSLVESLGITQTAARMYMDKYELVVHKEVKVEVTLTKLQISDALKTVGGSAENLVEQLGVDLKLLRSESRRLGFIVVNPRRNGAGPARIFSKKNFEDAIAATKTMKAARLHMDISKTTFRREATKFNLFRPSHPGRGIAK